ncbi:NAD-dependent epimerase/dehydratase family protein [Kordiimonas aquimaris]|uniref:NAD-dependent epimerase/dehydratase family protein n=1 Tax=Kordiimonas aquimaris TaxID=707591 RepID=UPI0021D2B428|nr:NAD(P)-dependent oxidoreductase [Kordiimonas aquimaris]
MPSKIKANKTGQTIALTGATGFLGKHVLDALLESGHRVKALTRSPQIDRQNVEWVVGALDNETSLELLTQGTSTLIHLAGLTKALTRDIFFDVNVTGSKRLFDAAQTSGVQHVLHISSLAAREPRLSHYGASKAGTEMLLTARKWGFSWTILRPPAIYGPGDKEILKLLKASKYGFLPAPGSTRNKFSMIHVADLAKATAVLSDQSNKASILEIDDGAKRGYTVKDVASCIPKNNTKMHYVPVPYTIMASIGFINQTFAHMLNKPAMLTVSTARYLCHADWTVTENRRFRHEKWAPQFDLKSGLQNTLDWYRKNDLL